MSKSDGEIMEGYRTAEGLKKTEMADALGISRQLYNLYTKKNGSVPSSTLVMMWFLRGAEEWVREMALELFVRRPELERPCVCLEMIGDNGPCPRHAATLVEET